MSDVPSDIVAAAEWWSANNGRYWRTRKVLLSYINANGPVPLPDGRRLGWMPDGNSWDGEGVALVMPSLIKHAELTVSGPQERIERLLSIALEEFPGLTTADYAVKRTVDAASAKAVIAAGGEAAEKLLPHRVSKSKLGVR